MATDYSKQSPTKETGTYRLRPSQIPPARAVLPAEDDIEASGASDPEESAAEIEILRHWSGRKKEVPTGRVAETRRMKPVR